MADHIPLRMCVACRKMHPQNELIRLVNVNGAIKLDIDKKLFGRGAYICRSAECVAKARKKNILARHFRHTVSEEIYNMAEDML